jgi:DNA-nicking Smr family endonuclease
VAKKTLSSKDRALFRQSIGEVSAIKAANVAVPIPPRLKPVPKRDLVPEQPWIKTAADLHTVGLEDSLEFAIEGLRPNTLKKMRQGQFGIDAEIDLHGLNSADAKRQLLYFLHDCINDGYRCVHIVHGKGYRSLDNQPVLKNNLNLWLRQHRDVQAFCSASPKDGGAGAVLVLLRLSEKYRQFDKFEE